ncbi:MAG: hypothetical protein VYA30_02310 [Myxococcota bacterium]|nr:hypothetical protein [Myxococcota bacterium]
MCILSASCQSNSGNTSRQADSSQLTDMADIGIDAELDGGTNDAALPQDSMPFDDALQAVIERAVFAAGQTEDERVRFDVLTELAAQLPSDHHLQVDLQKILPIIERWAYGRERFWSPGEQEMAGEGGYLASDFVQRVWPGAESYPPSIEPDARLRPIWCIYRARVLIWSTIQTGLFSDEAFEEARVCLRVAQDAFPDNQIIGMYLDRPIPWTTDLVSDPTAPHWANQQRLALHKLNQVIHFWIDQRQADDGQFGGGWGDDVELWRWWAPILIGFEDPKVSEAHRRLANGVFSLPRMELGYSSILTDVEHSSEETADTIIPALLRDPASILDRGRAAVIGELMSRLWFGENEFGFQQFKSTYLNSTAIDDSPEHACDTPYHTRVIAPVLRLWQLEPEHSVGQLIRGWLDNWVAVSARDESGKAAGLLPAAIDFPSGQVRQDNAQWWRPGCHVLPTLFRYPRAVSMLSIALVQAHVMTGEPRYLEPLRFVADNRDQADPDAEPGSLAWALSELSGQMLDAMSKYRLATDQALFDGMLRSRGNVYVRSILTGNRDLLDGALDVLNDQLSVDYPAHTSEVLFTDRVFKFHRRYADQFRDVSHGRPDTKFLYQMITGDFGDGIYFPLRAVKWNIAPTDLAVRVHRNRTDSFESELFNFSESSRRIPISLYRLNDSAYRWEMSCNRRMPTAGRVDQIDDTHSFTVVVPPRTLCQIAVEPL